MRPGRSVLLAVSMLAAALTFALVSTAVAHAILLESSPAINSTVAGPDVAVKLRFNVRIDASRSRLTLIRPDASTQSLLLNKDATPDMLSSQAQKLSPGEYRLRWQVLASDGHITRGEIPFQVTQP